MPIQLFPRHWPRCQYRVRYAEARESIFSIPGWRTYRQRYWVIDVGPRKGRVRIHGEVYRRTQQSVGLYAPGTLYEEDLEVGQLVSWTWLVLEEKGTPSHLRTLTGKAGFTLLDDPRQAVRKAIIELVDLSRSNRAGRAFHLNALLYQILGTLFDLHQHERPQPPAAIAPVHPWRAAARDWLEGHGPTLTSQRLADALGVSLSTLTHGYRHHCGETLGQTIAEWRQDKAIVLLSRPDLSIKEIADRLGFAHQSHFSSFFQAATGYTPSRYRQLGH